MMDDDSDDKDSKRKSRNLSEKKRRDQFNLLVNELSSMVSTGCRKMDKSTVLKSTISFLKNHNEITVRSRINEIQEDWKPTFLTNEEFTHLVLEAVDGFIMVFSASGHIYYASESIASLLGYLPEHVNTSIADESTEYLDSSVHSSKAVTEGEGNNTDVTSHTSTDLNESCYAMYLTKERRSTQEQKDLSNQKYRYIHKLAFESLKTFIVEEVLENNKVMYFAQLFRRYQALLLEFGESEIDFDFIKDYRAEMLQKKIEKIFGDRVTIEASSGPRHQKIIYKTDIDISIMANNTKLLESKEDHKYEDVAYDLRNCIKNIDSHPLPRRLTADDIIRGECEIPEELFNFIQNLVFGPNFCEKNVDSTTTKIKSICSDIIYAVTKGRCKPAKNLTLGLAMKSSTNSRQVITMLNRYGHSIGYNLAEELETEMTYTSIQNNAVIPAGIIATSTLSTHVAFDNFDRFVDTTSGKDTMHDTVGIIYQFTSADNVDNLDTTTSSEPEVNEEGPLRKRRREIRPYYSKPKTNLQLLPVDSFTTVIDVCQGATEVATDKDLLWIMSLSKLDSVPMWLGYNCLISIDLSEKQKIKFLPPINSSPTSYAIVNETLVMANEIAEKCQQEQIIVTYDLAIAKMAMKIQEKEKPKFDKVFVNLGAFHMEMAFFKAIGKYIDGSGLVEILVRTEVLANGSMNSFLDSKHFNRCKRLHPLIAAALQVLHFEKYLSTTNMTPEMLTELLQTQMQNTTNENSRDINEVIELPDVLSRIMNGYKEFCRQTLMDEFELDEINRAKQTVLKLIQEDNCSGVRDARLASLMPLKDGYGILELQDTGNFHSPMILPSEHPVGDVLSMTIYELASEDEQTNLYNILLNPAEEEKQVVFSCHLRRGGPGPKSTPIFELVHFVGYFSKNHSFNPFSFCDVRSVSHGSFISILFYYR
ncbi:hypothetical protein JTB14_004270 [Gonioctena quinquepunctata]|nr:hypothetical protein JTB14_004270 [Gonioctena quinquepunctata]